MPKKPIKVDLNGESQIKMELNTESSLKNIRAALLDSITFPFKFVYIDDDDKEKEIQREDEINKILDDILDVWNLHI